MAGAAAPGAGAPTPQAEVDATAKADQQKKDVSDRQALIAKANDAEGTITIQTTRAMHFSHPGTNEGVTVRPNTPTVVPAWVEHTDAWGLATSETKIEGIPPQIQVLKDAKPGTVSIASSTRGTDAPKTPEQRKADAEAAAAVLAQYEDADQVFATARANAQARVQKRDTDDAKRKADDEKVQEEQAERLRQQKAQGDKTPPSGGAGPAKTDDPTQGALSAGANAQKSGDAAKTAQK